MADVVRALTMTAVAAVMAGGCKRTEIPRYTAPRTATPPTIDGNLDEPAWQAAPWTEWFVDTLTGGRSPVATRARMTWDDGHLYFAFENRDDDVWASQTARDAKLWREEAVEIMLDADGNGRGYVELQVAPTGAVMDTYLPLYRQYEDTLEPGRKPFDWDARLRAAVKVNGTLNARDDRDQGWTVEIALPLADAHGLSTENVKLPPRPGDTFRVNMFRMDAPKGKPQDASGWSAPLVGDFHALDRFGVLVFGE